MRSFAVLVLLIAALSTPQAYAGGANSPPDLSGAWTTYPSRAKGPPPDPKLVAPQPTPLQLNAKYAAAYEAKRAAQRESDKRGEPLANASTECVPNGMPQMMFPIYPIEILQTHGQVTIIAEAMSQVRRIFLDQPQTKIEETPPTYFGHSVGRWEGDTLVVDTVGFNEKFWVIRGGLPHTRFLHLVERYTRTDFNTLKYEATIDDKGAYTTPWSGGWTLPWQTTNYDGSPGGEIHEYFCIDNEQDSQALER
jgi:hypothetical protein